MTCQSSLLFESVLDAVDAFNIGDATCTSAKSNSILTETWPAHFPTPPSANPIWTADKLTYKETFRARNALYNHFGPKFTDTLAFYDMIKSTYTAASSTDGGVGPNMAFPVVAGQRYKVQLFTVAKAQEKKFHVYVNNEKILHLVSNYDGAWDRVKMVCASPLCLPLCLNPSFLSF